MLHKVQFKYKCIYYRQDEQTSKWEKIKKLYISQEKLNQPII